MRHDAGLVIDMLVHPLLLSNFEHESLYGRFHYIFSVGEAINDKSQSLLEHCCAASSIKAGMDGLRSELKDDTMLSSLLMIRHSIDMLSFKMNDIKHRLQLLMPKVIGE